ncbi:Lipocalin-like domain-containing protein [Halenospora varia]|nr:Lipocalin-like domain-containing protein [Halenospora varia]
MKGLLGIWKLILIQDTDGWRGPSPYGPHPDGRIIFTPQGYMTALVTNTDNYALFPSGVWSQADNQTRADISRGVLTYEGKYTVYQDMNDTRVRILVEVALDPSWIGTNTTRAIDMWKEGDRELLMLTPIYSNNTRSGSHLTWEKYL